MTILFLLLIAAISYGNYRLCIFAYRFHKKIREANFSSNISPFWLKTMKISFPVIIAGTALNAICTGIGLIWVVLQLLIYN
jgi:hypothetical protein